MKAKRFEENTKQISREDDDEFEDEELEGAEFLDEDI